MDIFNTEFTEFFELHRGDFSVKLCLPSGLCVKKNQKRVFFEIKHINL